MTGRTGVGGVVSDRDCSINRELDEPSVGRENHLSITDFSQRYADQNERDYQEFVTAVRSGRLEALEGV